MFMFMFHVHVHVMSMYPQAPLLSLAADKRADLCARRIQPNRGWGGAEACKPTLPMEKRTHYYW